MHQRITIGSFIPPIPVRRLGGRSSRSRRLLADCGGTSNGGTAAIWARGVDGRFDRLVASGLADRHVRPIARMYGHILDGRIAYASSWDASGRTSIYGAAWALVRATGATPRRHSMIRVARYIRAAAAGDCPEVRAARGRLIVGTTVVWRDPAAAGTAESWAAELLPAFREATDATHRAQIWAWGRARDAAGHAAAPSFPTRPATWDRLAADIAGAADIADLAAAVSAAGDALHRAEASEGLEAIHAWDGLVIDFRALAALAPTAAIVVRRRPIASVRRTVQVPR